MEYTITKLRRFSAHRFLYHSKYLGTFTADQRFELFACEGNNYLWQYFILDRSWDRNSVSGVPVFALIGLSVKDGKLSAYVDTSKHRVSNISDVLKQATQRISMARKR